MANELEKQKFVSEIDSHWVPLNLALYPTELTI